MLKLYGMAQILELFEKQCRRIGRSCSRRLWRTEKVNLTGAVSSVKGDAFETRPLADATQGLQGMVPGLTVSNNSAGRPGATGTLTLRGQGNLSGNASPYVLVDGVEMELSDVNPNDIESISVLKDAAACSIYGARAAYGVILVTTKKVMKERCVPIIRER